MKIQINGVTFNVSDSGAHESQQPALVFLHGFGGSSRSWCGVTEHLQNDFRCIAPDLRGFGDTDAAPDDYRVSDAADDVSALIAGLNLPNYVLIGHSMGGKIALEMAARRPAGLRSSVLLAPSPPTPEPMEERERARLASTRGERAAALETIGKVTACPLPAAVVEIAVEDNLKSSRAAWQAWLEGGSREDISARAGCIRVPVLVVAGACDSAMTPALLQREVVARIADAGLTEIPDAAHFLPLETSAAVAQLIRKWVESNDRVA